MPALCVTSENRALWNEGQEKQSNQNSCPHLAFFCLTWKGDLHKQMGRCDLDTQLVVVHNFGQVSSTCFSDHPSSFVLLTQMMQFRFLQAFGHLMPLWTHFEAHQVRKCLSHRAQPSFDLTCHTSLLIPKLLSQLSSELFCSTREHLPQSPAGANKGIHFFYTDTNTRISIQTEGRAD